MLLIHLIGLVRRFLMVYCLMAWGMQLVCQSLGLYSWRWCATRMLPGGMDRLRRLSLGWIRPLQILRQPSGAIKCSFFGISMAVMLGAAAMPSALGKGSMTLPRHERVVHAAFGHFLSCHNKVTRQRPPTRSQVLMHCMFFEILV